MSERISYLIQGKNVIVVIDGQSHTISKDTHIAYPKIIEALKAQDLETLRELVEPKKAIANFGNGYVEIVNNQVMWKGQPFHNALATRMLEMFHEGFPIDPMVAFMENMMKNPSKRSVDQLYGFLEKNNLPITEDGYFLAYKKVRQDFKDIHSGKIYNGVGAIVEMDRNQVDDNPDSYCSSGLHFCSIDYLDGFGGHNDPVMILKINPADVVSIPSDCNGAKGRACCYEVVAQVDGNPADAFASIVDGRFVPEPVVETREGFDDVQDTDSHPKGSESSVNEDLDQIISKLEEDEDFFDPNVDEDLYDVVRVNGGDIVEMDLELNAARDLVSKNAKNKKAKLKIVKAGTDEEVQ